MMNDESIEDFLQSCENAYEILMVQDWDRAETLDDLQAFHTTHRIEMGEVLVEKWIDKMGSERMPENLKQQVFARIDKNFEMLTTHFKNKEPTVVEEPKKNPRFSRYFSLYHKPPKKDTDNDAETKDIAIGIDLGTTMCCVAVLHQGKVEIVPNIAQGSAKTTPSYVTFQTDGSDTFGMVSKMNAYRYPETTIYDAKRMIGRSWQDEHLQNDMKVWPFEVVEENGNPKVTAVGRTRYPHEISARLLSRFRAMAEEFLGMRPGTITKAVITVPAYFSEPQRRATNDAAICAGLDVLNILSEPTAAAIAYNWDKSVKDSRRTLIYDFGGGTFDVAIAVVSSNNVKVIGVHGDTHLGGQDFDQLLVEHCIREFKQTTGIDLLEGKYSEDKKVRQATSQALFRLRHQCEARKEWLSSTTISTIDVAFIVGTEHLSVDVTRDVLEELCMPTVKKTLEIVDLAIQDAVANETSGINGKEDIDDIIMIGGSTRMPLVKKMVKDFFGGKQLCVNIDPDQAVAYGAAIQADILRRRGTGKRRDSTPPSPTIQDVTPRTVGIECLGNVFSKVIPRNAKIPCEHVQIYNTAEDNQTSLRFTVRQGESNNASENILLGEFFFNGIPEAPATQEKIKVTMIINEKGILQVKAVSLTTGMENAITITSNKLGMSSEEIEELSKRLSSAVSIEDD